MQNFRCYFSSISTDIVKKTMKRINKKSSLGYGTTSQIFCARLLTKIWNLSKLSELTRFISICCKVLITDNLKGL